MKRFSGFIRTLAGVMAIGSAIYPVLGRAETSSTTTVDAAPVVPADTAPTVTTTSISETVPTATAAFPAEANPSASTPTPPALTTSDQTTSSGTAAATDTAANTSALYVNPERSNASAIASKQLLGIQAGQFEPQSVSITNGSYNFVYSPDSLKSAWVEAGFGAHLFDFFGSFYFEMSLNYTSFEGRAQSDLPSSAGQSLSVMLLGFDPRIMYQATWFPIKFLIPFVDGGYQYTLYYQSGPSDLQSVEGGVGNAVAGAGLAIWLNRGASLRTSRATMFSSFPIYLTAKVNQIFPRSGGLDLESRSFLGGVTFGL